MLAVTQGINNRPGIKCKNGRLEMASQITDHFYLVDKIFAQFFLLDESCIYYVHVGT
jgi:propanediol dehydratase large subunit